MNKIHQFLVLIASVIVFLLGYMFIKKGDLPVAIPFFALSIILYQAASHIKITMQIAELKKTIGKPDANNENPDNTKQV
jgi:hypothetical protein